MIARESLISAPSALVGAWVYGMRQFYSRSRDSMQHERPRPPARAFAAPTVEMDKPGIAASVLACTGYECSGCGCRVPETRPPQGRARTGTCLLEKIHMEREFARQSLCSARMVETEGQHRKGHNAKKGFHENKKEFLVGSSHIFVICPADTNPARCIFRCDLHRL